MCDVRFMTYAGATCLHVAQHILYSFPLSRVGTCGLHAGTATRTTQSMRVAQTHTHTHTCQRTGCKGCGMVSVLFSHCHAMQFDLRNGALRKKFDGLKYTLKKLEVGAWHTHTHTHKHTHMYTGQPQVHTHKARGGCLGDTHTHTHTHLGMRAHAIGVCT